MGIKESNLPIAESLGSGDKLRIVTSEGESKQIGADSVGDNELFIVAFNIAEDPIVSDRTFAEILNAIKEKKHVVGITVGTLDYDLSIHDARWYHLDNSNPGAITFIHMTGNAYDNVVTSFGITKFIVTAGNQIIRNTGELPLNS